MKKLLLLLTFMACTMSWLYAQQVQVQGTVTSSDDQMGLPGVNVSVKGTTKGTVTDMDGKFSLYVDKGVTLVVSYIGYKTKEVTVENQSNLALTLEVNPAQLSEVVVVGYGTQKRKDLTGAVSSIDGGALQDMSVPRIEQALAGRAAGVQISTTDASPGAGMNIRIRGDNSINANNAPLVVIDGFIGGDLSTLNNADIESFQILKDASATAIYGSRGANGVIIVTTKTGREGKTEVALTAEYGVQQLSKKLDLMDAGEYWAVRTANEQDIDRDSWEVSNVDTTGVGTDWQDAITQEAVVQRYNLRVTGGGSSTRYAAFFDYFGQDGLVKGSGYDKGTFRLNLDHDVSNKLTVGTRMVYYNASTNNTLVNGGYGSLGGPITLNALRFPPIIPVMSEEGDYNIFFNNSSQVDNPVKVADLRMKEQQRDYLRVSGYLEYALIPDLKYRLNVGYLTQNHNGQEYISKELQAALNEGIARIDNWTSSRWLVENTLSYTKTLGEKHNLNALVGFTTQLDERFRSGLAVSGFSTEVLSVNNVGVAENVLGSYSELTESKQMSVLGRLNYSYDGKYLLTMTGRSDGSSVFAKNNKWAFFPSASIGWNINEEEFLKSVDQVSTLKLRAGYGESGNQAIQPYQSLASYGTGIIYTKGSTQLNNGVAPERLSNSNLRWETTVQTNIGLDMGFYNERLTATMDLYRKETNDLLYEARLAPNSGFTSQLQNIGSIENKGLELSLSARLIEKKDFSWDVSGNVSFVRNKILDLGADSLVVMDISGGAMGGGFRENGALVVGQPLGQIYGYEYIGIYQDQGEVDALPRAGAAPGRPKYADINGDGEVNADDRTVIGNALPDFYYGLSTNLTYKNIGLNVVLRGVQGVQVANLGKVNLLRPGGLNNGLREVMDYWTPENGSNDMIAVGQTWDEMSSRFVEDASFLRVQNISLSYNVPSQWLEKAGVKSLRLYANAVNWFTFTDYSGYDPEVNSRQNDDSNYQNNVQRGIDNGAYPAAKQLMFGLNLSF
ncbi:TonB-dependent receptor [Algivirga pacifica]|uniref:TonB-dependent receptor n=1 Tax=Algivirga pacifica TaxID=1162670 RepID=A0ABP9D372_9BACT